MAGQKCTLLGGSMITYNCLSHILCSATGHPIIVDLLLRNGAKIDSVNKIGRTAAQLGGFVGQWLV